MPPDFSFPGGRLIASPTENPVFSACNRWLLTFQPGLVDFSGAKCYHKATKWKEVASMNLGENIYQYRTQKNMSQGDLADALDVPSVGEQMGES